MPVKESSDELNPPVVTAGVAIAPARGKRSASDYLALAVATCGVGYLPLAPGTWGSLVGVVLCHYWKFLRLRLIYASGGDEGSMPGWIVPFWAACTMLLAFFLTMIGIWAASRVEKILGRKDPGIVVIDEVVGQFITLALLPYYLVHMWTTIIAGFLLFRAFDIWKPYPIRRLERLESGLGIMADDVLAGVYAAMVLLFLASIDTIWRF